MFCLKCGQELPQGAEFCFKCGTSQAAAAPYMSLTSSERINLDGAHTFVPAMCPNCNAHLKVDSSSKIARCDTCGTECLVQDAIKALTVKGNVQVGSATINVNGANIDGLLRRAEIMLADGNFAGAKEKCDSILDVDPTNVEAYIIMLMAALRVNRQDDLANCRQPFDTNNFYLKAMQFGDEQTKAKLTGYINKINERNRYEYLKGIYDKAVLIMESASTESGYEYAIELLKLTPDFLDSNERIEECLRRIEETKAERAEKERLEKIQKEKEAKERLIAKKKARKLARKIAILFTIAVLVIAIAVIVPTVIIPNLKYKKAMKLYNSGNYSKAEILFTELGDYKESSKYMKLSALMSISVFDQETTEKLYNCKAGDIISLGDYHGSTEWIVLEVNDSRIHLLSKNVLDSRRFDDDKNNWENSEIREWLNKEFIMEAFSNEEAALIQETDGDKVTLLSVEEATNLLNDDMIAAEPTEFAITRGVYTSWDNGCIWWLRSPGTSSDSAAYVRINGDILMRGSSVSKTDRGVRPAIWIDYCA